MIRITAKQDGFRRAGMAHSKEPKDYPDNKFTKEQLAALKAEPMLIVEEILKSDLKATDAQDLPEKKSGKGRK